MKFYSTNNKSIRVSLYEAVTRGLAADGGLYMPEVIHALPAHFLSGMHQLSHTEIAMGITRHLIGDDVPRSVIEQVVSATISFDVPLTPIEDRIWSLELFHGPTLAFKDFGARFMSSLLGYFAREKGDEYTILVATSGDTGSAVAHGFHNVDGIKVVVLYPSGKVSDLQEKQFTTLGDNITAVEIEGTFDDCQRLVKAAFGDQEMVSRLNLTSANSINIARLIPQSFYFFFAYSKMPKGIPVVFSVPSGNFGNLTGGIFAQRMGLPVHQFIAATNSNDVVPVYLNTQKFEPRPSVQTISNAMDVGNPSNFARLLDLFGHDYHLFSKAITGFAFSDEETRKAMRAVYDKVNYMLDPHGAVGYLGLKKYLDHSKEANGIFLETAHPGKFRDVVEDVLETKIVLPERLSQLVQREKKSIKMSKAFIDFREFLLG